MFNGDTILFLLISFVVTVIAKEQFFSFTQSEQVQTRFYSGESKNTTFEIWVGGSINYYLVSIDSIQPQNSQTVLLFAYNFPPIIQNKEIKYSGIDFDGFAQQTGNHFIIIPNTQEIIYVTVQANQPINFTITVKGSSDKQECIYDCFNQGKCLQGKCLCDQGFVGRDCSIQAEKLYEEIPLKVVIPNNVAYFYYETSHKKESKKLTITVQLINNQTDSFKNVSIGITSGFILSLPTINYSLISAQINSSSQFILKFSPPKKSNEQKDSKDSFDQSRVVMAVWGEENNNLIIKIDEICDETEKFTLTLLVLCIVGSVIMTCAVAYFIIRKWKNSKKRQYEYDHKDCAICLELIFNGKPIRKLICGHRFHQVCINNWLQIRQACPLCFQNVQTNAL